MFQFVLGENLALDLSRSSQGMFEYEYFFRPDSSAYSCLSTGAVRLMESPGAAKAAGVFSCYFAKRLPGVAKKLPSDFTAESCVGVQHAVEDLNKPTFRDPDTEIRTKYGVYVT